MYDIPRREFIIKGSAALTAVALINSSRAYAYPGRPGEAVIPWLDQPPPQTDPADKTLLVWEDLDSWITPNDKFFSIAHFDRPIIDASTWKLEIDGPRQEALEPDARRHQSTTAAGGRL